MKFETYKDRKGEWRWRLKARNSRIVATSGEGYTRKANCISSIARFRLGVWSARSEVKAS